MIVWLMALVIGAVCCSAYALFAQEPINGGFGIELGRKVERQYILSLETDDFHYDYYLVSPPEYMGEFQHYAVYVNQLDRTIYRIKASGRFATRAQCRDLAVQHVTRLTALHGSPVENDLHDSGRARFTDGTRVIVVVCLSGPRLTYLHITYTDSELAQRARGCADC